MINKERFAHLLMLVANLYPKQAGEFATYERRMLSDIQEWLNLNCPKVSGRPWTRDDVAWGIDVLPPPNQPLPPDPVPDPVPVPRKPDAVAALADAITSIPPDAIVPTALREWAINYRQGDYR